MLLRADRQARRCRARPGTRVNCLPVDLGVHREQVGEPGVGDELLGAVEPPRPSASRGWRACGSPIASEPAAGLGERSRRRRWCRRPGRAGSGASAHRSRRRRAAGSRSRCARVGHRERLGMPIASVTTVELVMSSPAPPYASGTSMPTNPSRPSARQQLPVRRVVAGLERRPPRSDLALDEGSRPASRMARCSAVSRSGVKIRLGPDRPDQEARRRAAGDGRRGDSSSCRRLRGADAVGRLPAAQPLDHPGRALAAARRTSSPGRSVRRAAPARTGSGPSAWRPWRPSGWPSAIAPPLTLVRLLVQPEPPDDRHDLGGERLVQLDQVDVVERQAGLGERLRDGRRPDRCP